MVHERSAAPSREYVPRPTRGILGQPRQRASAGRSARRGDRVAAGRE